MQITLSRRNFLKGAAAVGLVGPSLVEPMAKSSSIFEKVVDKISAPESMVKIFDAAGNLLGSTTKIVTRFLDDGDVLFDIGTIDIEQTGTAEEFKLFYKGVEWIIKMQFDGPVRVCKGDSVTIKGAGTGVSVL